MPLDSSFHNTQIYIVGPRTYCTLTFECIETLKFLKLYFIRLHSFRFCNVQLDAIQFFLTIYSKECRLHFRRNRPRIAILCTYINDAIYFGIYLFCLMLSRYIICNDFDYLYQIHLPNIYELLKLVQVHSSRTLVSRGQNVQCKSQFREFQPSKLT